MYLLDTQEIAIALVTKIEQFIDGVRDYPADNSIRKFGEEITGDLLKDFFKGKISAGCFELLKNTVSNFQKLTGGLKADVNADLQRAIRRSCLKATVFACQKLIQELQGEMQTWEDWEQPVFIQRINAFNRYIQKVQYKILPLDLQKHTTKEDITLSQLIDIQQKLQTEIIETESASYKLPITAATFQFDKLVQWDHVHPLKEYFEDLRNQMLDEVLIELTVRFPSAPCELGKIIRNGWRIGLKEHSWFDEVTREFEGEIKHNNAVSNIYQAKVTTQIKTDVGILTLRLASFEERWEGVEGILVDMNSTLKDLYKDMLVNFGSLHNEVISLKKLIEIIVNSPTTNTHIIQNVNLEIFTDASNDFYKSQNSYIDGIIALLNKSHKVCLEGIPGIGKTYLAKKIAFDSFNSKVSNYEIIWWVDADDKKIDNELIQLAHKIFTEEKINEWTNSKIQQPEIIKKLVEELESHNKSWLLVFDNAKDSGSVEDLDKFTNKYIPKVKLGSDILITSRNKKWNLTKRKITSFEVGFWTEADARGYLRIPVNNFQIEISTPQQLEIFGKKGKLPLAVSIAKKYILQSRDKDRKNFTNFYNKWLKKENELKIAFLEVPSYLRGKNEDDFLSLLITVQISYDALSPQEKEVINLLACLGPDEFPFETIFQYKANIAVLSNRLIASYDNLRECIINLHELSLCTFNEEVSESSSIHRLIQECIRYLQGTKEISNNYKLGIHLLANTFDSISKYLLISHVDTLADAVLKESKSSYLDLINNMENKEKEEAFELFVKAGQYHFETGDIRNAENQYKSAIEVAVNMQANDLIDESRVVELKKSLANILFLKGKISEREVTALTDEISKYYERNEDTLSLVAFKNDVVNKIFQRQCRFKECEETLEEIENIVKTHNQHIEEDLYEHMVQRYVDNDSNKLAEKLSGIYHNLGSLYWTWGRPGDYEKSAEYFVKAIEFQAKFASALEDRILEINDTDVKDRLQKALNTKKLYLNVSRMIYGAVLGLLEKFTGQWDVHKEAFSYFSSRIASEKRRNAYTAYYMLSYSWDRSLDKGLPKDFNAKQLIDDIYRYDSILVGYDEKYDVIKKIVRLRIASKNLNSLERDELYAEAAEAHDELWKQLEDMKYDERKRYYDVDTCSVSAFLDYAQYLKEVDKDKAGLVVKQARAIIDGIVYPRRPELNQLAKDLGVD